MSRPFDTIRHAQQRAFLIAYTQCATVRGSADAAGIHRSTHYEWLKTDDHYADAFAKAEQMAVGVLEDEAHRRAVEGVRHYKFHQGKPIPHPVTGEPYYEHEYSDGLLQTLLKAKAPEKYAEHSRVEVSGQLEHAVEVSAALDRLRQSRAELERCNRPLIDTEGDSDEG